MSRGSTSRPAPAGATPWGSKREGLPSIAREPRPEEVVEPVQVRRVAYLCRDGHSFTLPLNAAAPVPGAWECRRCDLMADLIDAGGGTTQGEDERPSGRATGSTKTHFDRVLERRSREELQVLLDERLELLRARRGAAATPPA